jgi:LAS superfamily LD-carboxypeptidase LdcB
MSINSLEMLGVESTHLIPLDSNSSTSLLINKTIERDLKKLLKAAATANLEIKIISSYRSFDRQLSIWNAKWQGHTPVFSRYGRPLNIAAMSDMEKYKAISLWSALPGFSRHHWGTDLDIFLSKAIQEGHKVALTQAEFSNEGVCADLNQWLDRNLESYGFFRPYRQYQQGISPEPWHISHFFSSNKVFNNFCFPSCIEQLEQSEIKARRFILDIIEHYKDNYFHNICSPLTLE